MKRCRIRVAVFFLVLMSVPIFIVPTRTLDISYERDAQTNMVRRTSSKYLGFKFLPRFLKREKGPLLEESSYLVRYALQRHQLFREMRVFGNIPVFLAEVFLIGTLAAFDFVFLCSRRRRRRPIKSPSYPPGGPHG